MNGDIGEIRTDGSVSHIEGEIFLADYSRITIGETCFPIGSAYLNDISFIQVFVHERINVEDGEE